MALTLGLETLFHEVLNTSLIFPITSKVRSVKGLDNSILTYVPNMIHICPNIKFTSRQIGQAFIVFIFQNNKALVLCPKVLGSRAR